MVKISDLTVEKAESIVEQSAPSDIKTFYDNPYLLDKKQIEKYRENGFIALPGILENEALDYTRQIISAAVFLRKESDKRMLSEKSQYEQSFLQCGYMCWDFPAVREFVFGKRFAGIARDLMQVDHVRLWHDQSLFKEPGGRITDMHQDISYWPVNTPHTITFWLALVDVTTEKGNLYFLPGTHRDKQEYVDIFENPHVPDRYKGYKEEDVILKAGDGTFHSGRTYHGARINRTKEMRKATTVIYIADGTRFDASDERNATHTSCEGLADGEIIDTKYTPLLI